MPFDVSLVPIVSIGVPFSQHIKSISFSSIQFQNADHFLWTMYSFIFMMLSALFLPRLFHFIFPSLALLVSLSLTHLFRMLCVCVCASGSVLLGRFLWPFDKVK